ncbi:uncharacterized protein LOC114223892 [Eumetopias jubatus]|uniref:uncharacterized protein LOC114223892 n=1 Tax=Eumetopias jubatus TaxID=34886 RepID=UPI001015E402|nr:uncharacterized protein LOC114223892 [Eumetopias jubatus]
MVTATPGMRPSHNNTKKQKDEFFLAYFFQGGKPFPEVLSRPFCGLAKGLAGHKDRVTFPFLKLRNSPGQRQQSPAARAPPALRPALAASGGGGVAWRGDRRRGAGPAAGATRASRADANDAAPARPQPRRPAVGPASARPRPSRPGLPSAPVRLWRLAARCAPSLLPGRGGLCSGTPPRPFGAAASAPLASAPPSPPPHAGSDMAHAAVRCPSARGSGDGEMGKPRKVALITGITGQDGSYLAEFLLEKGYEVHGIVRRSSSFNTGRIEHLYKNPQAHIEGNMKLHYGDLTDSTCLVKIINEVKPTEIYNLGAQSHVKDKPQEVI